MVVKSGWCGASRNVRRVELNKKTGTTMRIAMLLAPAAAFVLAALPAPAQTPVSRLDPMWLQQAERHWYEEQIAAGRPPATLLFGLDDPQFTGSYGKGTLYELNRLFDYRPGEDEPNWRFLRNKTILALPLLREGNGFQMLFRPQADIYATYLKRIAARRLEMLGRTDAPPGSIAIDTHIHTCFSHDSLADPAEMIRTAARRGLAGIAITDHNTMEGARKGIEALPHLVSEGKVPATFFVIPGEEISSANGHIVGLFLKHEIQPGLSADHTVDEIHAQGGIAIAAHPRLEDGVGDLANTLPFDAVETSNSAEDLHFAIAGRGARQRAAFYAKVTKPHIGASDAHDPDTVAADYTLLANCAPNAEAARAAMLAGRCTPVSDAEDQTAMHNIRGSVPRLLSAYNSLFGSETGGLSLFMKRMTHADAARVSLLPSPWVYLSTRF